MITRNLSNALRWFLDSFLPLSVRNNYWCMYPLFYIWCKGKNVSKFMKFKEYIETMTEEEYKYYYQIANTTMASDRNTDLNKGSIHKIINVLKAIGDKNISILDVGTGKGWFLNLLKKEGFTNIMGTDFLNTLEYDVPFTESKIEKLPFQNKSYDIVICNHVIEHILNTKLATEELKRVAKNKFLITTPCQYYFKYTFDLHVNFYPRKVDLTSMIDHPFHECIYIEGDWLYIGAKVK